MLDRNARRVAARLVRAFALGRITNVEVDRHWPVGCEDIAVADAYDWAWSHWDDNRKHRLVGKDALSATSRAEAARLILYLRSDKTFATTLHPHPPRIIWSIMGRGIPVKRWWRARKAVFSERDMAVWPFPDRKSLKREARRPRRGLL